MANPALEALRRQQALMELLATEGGLVTALAETVYPRLTPAQTPGEMERAITEAVGRDPDDASKGPAVRALVESFRARVERAVPYWVDSQMTEIVIAAAESRPTLPLTQEDFPTSTGFVWFDTGMEIGVVDQDGVISRLVITSLLWTRAASANGRTGVWVTFFSDPASPKDELSPLLRANRTVDPFRGLRGFVPAWTGMIEFGGQLDHTWWEQVTATFFHLLQSTTATTTSTVDADRKMMRRFDNSDRPVIANTVTVVTLRRQKPRPKDDPDTPTADGRKVRVRYMVGDKTGGFFRTYHTKNGPELRFILPYIAGPEGAPLVWKRHKVYAWRR